MKKLGAVLFLLIQYIFVFSQTENSQLKPISLEKGLSNETVKSVYKDKNGFVWFGTPDGLNRFDGYKFVVYKTETNNPQSLSNNSINSITEDNEGNLWIGTDGGLNLLDRKSDTFQQFLYNPKDNKSISNNHITSLFISNDGAFWIGTQNGLSKYDPKNKNFFRYSIDPNPIESGKNNDINSIVEDSKGNIWIASWLGWISKFDRKTGLYKSFLYPKKNIQEQSTITHIFIDEKDQLWLTHNDRFCGSFNTTSLEFSASRGEYNNAPNLTNNMLWETLDNKGQLWYFDGRNFHIYNPKTKSYRNFPSVVNDNSIDFKNAPILINNDGNGQYWFVNSVYLCYNYDSHLNKFIEYYHTFPVVNNKLQDYVRRITKDKNGNTWFATFADGLIMQDANTGVYSRYQLSKDNNDNGIYSFLVHSSNQIWIGANNGISVMDLNTKKNIKRLQNNPSNTNSLHDNTIRGMFEDSKKNVWITNSEGLDHYNPSTESYSHYSMNNLNGLCYFNVSAIMEDNEGYIWIGTFNGLNRYDYKTNTFQIYKAEDDPTGLLDSYINTNGLFQTRDGLIWIATRKGLNSFDKKTKKFSQYSSKDGFATDYLYSMTDDKAGNLWCVNPQGLSKFNYKSKEVINYGESSGLLNNIEAFYKDVNGIFYVGGKKTGYYAFSPDSLFENKIVPPIFLTDFLLLNKSVRVSTQNHSTPLKESISFSKRIELKYNQASFITFEFSSLNLTLSDQNKYAYKLTGFNDFWVYTNSKNRYATFTNLNPGHYTLTVKGSNNDGVWNELGTSLEIVILPPFWKTWWFKLLMTLSIVVSIIMVFRLRVAAINRQKIILEETVKRRTAQVLTQKEEIQTQADHLKDAYNELNEKQTEIQAQAEELQEANVELQKLNSTKDKFFAIIGHDLKNPMHAMHGLLKMMKEKGSNMGQYELQDILIILEQSSGNVAELLENLLTWANTQSNSIVFNPVNFDVHSIIRSTINVLQVNADNKSIQLISEVPKFTMVVADKNMITTVIRNLINNAIKFTPQGNITISSEIKDNRVFIYVVDTGIGINEETKNKLFRLDVHHTTQGTSGESGTGLGLIICQEFIDKNNGTIAVESEMGEGSKFIIQLPLGTKDTNEEEQVDDAMDQSSIHQSIVKMEIPKGRNVTVPFDESKMLILIVDDAPVMRANVRNVLNETYNVIESTNGKDAIKYALDSIPDLIISDWMMPEMDGIEFCKTIKTDDRTSHVPIIMLTARAESTDRITGYETGADEYVTKPFDANVLLVRVKNLIDNRKQLQEYYIRTLANQSQTIEIQPKDINVVGIDERFLKKLTAIVEDRLSDPEFKVENLASDLGMVSRVLHRKLKALINQVPSDFIYEMRMKRSKQILLQKKVPIYEVADLVGFNDRKYFSICFRKFYGLSPTEYLKKHG